MPRGKPALPPSDKEQVGKKNLAACVPRTFWEVGELPDLMGEGGHPVMLPFSRENYPNCSLD